MQKSLIALTVLALLAFGAGCGGGSSTSTKKKPKKTKTTATAGLPTYAEVKALALEDPALKTQCDKGSEDRNIGAPQNGEVYKRLFCGDREVLDYVVGAGQYKENFSAARDLAFAPLWSKPNEAYVKVSVSGQKGLAAKVRQSCSCGEVVQPD